jgi:cell division protein ZapA
MKEFEDNYAVKDKQDLLAMCALQMLTEKKDHGKQGARDTFNKKLHELDRMLADYLEAQDE